MTNEISDILKNQISELPFIDRLAGLVRPVTINEETDSGKKRKSFPVACNVSAQDCVTSGKYQDLVPNSSRKSVIYFEEAGGTRMTGIERNEINFTSTVRLVGWLNLKKMGLTDCNWSATAILQIIKELSVLLQPHNSGMFLHVKITEISEAEKSNAIFSKYSYDEAVTQYLIYPYDYFALNLTIKFSINKNCIEAAEIPDIELCDTESGTVNPDTPTVGACWDLLRWDCVRKMWVRFPIPTTAGIYNLTVNDDGSLEFTEATTSGTIVNLKLTEADFTGHDYQNDLLKTLEPDIDFFLFSDSGSGSLLKVDDGYSFNDITGTITELFTVGKYRLQIFLL